MIGSPPAPTVGPATILPVWFGCAPSAPHATSPKTPLHRGSFRVCDRRLTSGLLSLKLNNDPGGLWLGAESALSLLIRVLRGRDAVDVDPFVIGSSALVAAAALLILYMPKWNERLAYLAAICGVAVAIIFVLQALR
jgi:hypothetical protein